MTKEAALQSAYYYEQTLDNLPEPGAIMVGKRISDALVKLAGAEALKDFPLLGAIASKLDIESPKEPVVIKTAEVKYTVKDTMAKVAEKLSYKQRESLPDSVFGLVVKDKSGKKIRKYPMHDENHVRAAITMFAKNKGNLPPKYRAVVARKIKAKAKQYNIEIDESNPINKYAEWENYGPNLTKEIETRKQLRPSSSKEYDSLLEKQAAYDPVEFAEELYKIDKKYGMHELYDKLLEDPYSATFSTVIEKHAAAPIDEELVSLLGALPEDRLKEVLRVFGPAFVDKYKEDPYGAISILEDSEKEALLEQLK